MSFQFEFLVSKPRQRFALFLLIPFALAAWLAFVIGGWFAPGWTGIGAEQSVQRWRWWGTIMSLSAATLGIALCTIAALVVVSEGRLARSTRFVSVFGAAITLLLCTFALRSNLETNHLLILVTGTLATWVAATIDALSTRTLRWVAMPFVLFACTAIFRVASWWLLGSASQPINPSQIAFARWLMAASFCAEALGQIAFLVVLIALSKWRGAISSVLALGAAFGIAYWALGTTHDHQGTLRDVVQRALSLRIQGLLPIWIDTKNMPHELALLDSNARASFLPLVFLELSSITLAFAALISMAKTSFPYCCTLALILLSRAQIDVPLRALCFGIAALITLILLKNTVISKSLQAIAPLYR